MSIKTSIGVNYFDDNSDNVSPRSTPRGDEEKSIVDICHTGCEQQD